MRRGKNSNYNSGQYLFGETRDRTYGGEGPWDVSSGGLFSHLPGSTAGVVGGMRLLLGQGAACHGTWWGSLGGDTGGRWGSHHTPWGLERMEKVPLIWHTWSTYLLGARNRVATGSSQSLFSWCRDSDRSGWGGIYSGWSRTACLSGAKFEMSFE